MNIPLPGYQPVQAPGPGPQLDPSTAGAPWQAVAQVGHVVQGLGEKGMDIVARVQDAALQKRTADMTLDLNKANAEYQAAIITNPGDPSKWSENYEKAIQPLREQWINDKSLSEPQRQHLNLEFNRIAGQASASIIRDSAVATVQNAKTAAGNVISQGEQDGDEATRERGFSLLKPWVSPADYDAARNRSDRNSNLNRIALGIDNDPKAWKDRLEGEDAAKNLGVPVEDLLRLRGRQEEAERRVTFDQIKQAKDEVASNPNLQPEDLERHFGKQLSPSVMATLKEDLAHRDDFALKTLHATPEYQQQTIGQVSAMLDGFKLQDDRYDEKAAQIDSLIRTLPADSASRANLSDWFDRVKTGQRMEVKTRLDQARKVLMDRYNEGGFGRVDGSGEVTQDVSSLVNAGYLRAESKLTDLGFSPEQAKAINSLDEGALQTSLAATMSPQEAEAKATELSSKLTDENRMTAFRLLYGSRTGEVKSSQFEQDAAKAIYEGADKFKYINEEGRVEAVSEREKARKSLGTAIEDLETWSRVHPQATDEQLDQHVFEVLGDDMRRRLQQSKLPPRTSANDVPDDERLRTARASGNIKEMIKYFEAGDQPDGFYRKAYWDHKQWTIGYGTRAKGPDDTVDQAEADRRLDAELKTHRSMVDQIAKDYGYNFNEAQRQALSSFSFNTGRLDQLLVLNGHRSPKEIADAMKLYRLAGDVPLRGLEIRRSAESDLFTNGYRK